MSRKERGGFYTPDGLARQTLDAARLSTRRPVHDVLEPSCGDGAFLRVADPAWRVTGVEVDGAEAEKARRWGHRVLHGSIFDHHGTYDMAVGNPPYVPLTKGEGSPGLRGARNLWAHVLHHTVQMLRRGGGFAFVVPEDVLSRPSYAPFRQFLLDQCASVAITTVGGGVFPGADVRVCILSGTVDSGPCSVSMDGRVITPGAPWTLGLLTADEQDEYLEAPHTLLRDRMAFRPSLVTGWNEFFYVPSGVVSAYNLPAVPLYRQLRPGQWLYTGSTEPTGGELEYIRAFEDRVPAALRRKDRWWVFNPPPVPDVFFPVHSHKRALAKAARGMHGSNIIYGYGDPGVVDQFNESPLARLSTELFGVRAGGGALELSPGALKRVRIGEGSAALQAAADRLQERRLGR